MKRSITSFFLHFFHEISYVKVIYLHLLFFVAIQFFFVSVGLLWQYYHYHTILNWYISRHGRRLWQIDFEGIHSIGVMHVDVVVSLMMTVTLKCSFGNGNQRQISDWNWQRHKEILWIADEEWAWTYILYNANDLLIFKRRSFVTNVISSFFLRFLPMSKVKELMEEGGILMWEPILGGVWKKSIRNRPKSSFKGSKDIENSS